MNRLLFLAIVALACGAQTLDHPSRGVTDPGVVTTRQAITPAGVVSIFQGRAFGAAWTGKPGEVWVLNTTQLYRLDWANNRVISRTPHGGTPGNQSRITETPASPPPTPPASR